MTQRRQPYTFTLYGDELAITDPFLIGRVPGAKSKTEAIGAIERALLVLFEDGVYTREAFERLPSIAQSILVFALWRAVAAGVLAYPQNTTGAK
jgi:hypothetical protein